MNASKMFRTAIMALIAVFLFSNMVFAGDFVNGGTLVNNTTKSVLVKTGSFLNYKTAGSKPGTVNNAGTIEIPALTKNFENGNGAIAGTVTNNIASDYGTINVRNDFNNSATGTLTNSSTAVVRVYHDFVHTASGTATNTGRILIKNTLSAGAGFTTSGGTVEFDSSGAQTIPSLTYGTLKALTGGTKTLAGTTTVNTEFEAGSGVTVVVSTNTLTLAGTVTLGGSLTSATNGTVEYTGAAQNVFASNYGNLTLSGSLTKTSVGTVSIAGSYSNSVTLSTVGFTTVSGATFGSNTGLTKASGTVTMGDGLTVNIGGTFEYTTAGQSVASAQYTNLTLSNGSGTVTLPASVYISGNYTPSGAGLRDYSTSTSALLFNGTTTTQTVSADANGTFYALAFAGDTQKDVTGTLATTSDFTIQSSVSGAVGVRVTGDLTVGGNLDNEGTLTNEGTITVN